MRYLQKRIFEMLAAISAEPHFRRRLDSFLPGEPEGDTISEIVRIRNEYEDEEKRYTLPKWLRRLKFPHVIEPQSKLYLLWLFIVTLAFMYNAWAIPLRAAFPYQTTENVKYWLICDYVCDIVYVIDILLFKMRISFLNSGLKETHRSKTRANYMDKKIFKFDCLSLLPLDLLYLIEMKVNPWCRLPRVLKIQTFWEFYSRCDHLVRSSHAVRIMRTFTYMLFLIHVETCGYYSMSVYEGIGINEWVYNGEGNAYIRCFYLATKTATSIGNNPTPQNELEYMFMTVYWVSGVFVFALLIGQIRDIFDAFNMVKTTYTYRMDGALNYVKNMNLPKDTQDRVRTWFIYNWQQQKVIDERSMMDALPMKLRKDLAIHVHFNTLSKVKLFSDCDKTLLFDLVLKLKPILYLPGDYVCKKGEIGKEMYIVSQGIVEVVGGPNNSLVLATLREGSVFGEISLLAMAAEGNRRTADVRCKGFTNLFILSKIDFENAMKDYPEAYKLLKKRAKKLLRMNARIERQSQCSMDQSKLNTTTIIRTPPETPKLVKTVLQIMDPESALMRKLSSRRTKEHGQTSETNSADGADNGAYDPGSDYHIGARRTTNVDVEDFYDDILSVHDWDEEHLKINNEMIKAHREQEDNIEATDTGVQDTTVTSPDSGTTTSASNKDSKESFISNTELGEIVEDIDDIEPTRDAINYTADMFGDIECQPRLTRSARSRSASKAYRLGSGTRGGGSCIVRRDDEYTKAFANGFTIIIDSVDDKEHLSNASLSSSESCEDDSSDRDEFAERHHSVEKKDIVTKTVTFQEETETSKKYTKSGNNKTASAPQQKSTSVYTNATNTTLVKPPVPVVNGKTSIQSKNKLGLKLKIENEKTTDFSPYIKSSANKKKTQTNKTRQQHNMSKPKTNNDNHSNSAIPLSESAIMEESNDHNPGKDIERTQSVGSLRSIRVSEADDIHSVDNVNDSTVSQNQVTCFADVHRETTLSPRTTNEEMATLCSPDMPASARQRKISVISIGSVLKDGRETLV